MSADGTGPLAPAFTACPCCGHWGSNFPPHCASGGCRWRQCKVCCATISVDGAHLNGRHGGQLRCLAAENR